MPKSKKRKKISDHKSHKRSAKYTEGGGESQYARKKAYCHKNGVWGFDVPEPKPWKKAR
jgi:endonuclease YncB( thermonuclease family)